MGKSGKGCRLPQGSYDSTPCARPPAEGQLRLHCTHRCIRLAIGATLRQLQISDGEPAERIIAYFSRKLHDAETRYSTYDKELLGVRDAVEHWKYYLKSGHKFRVQTDHSALQHILDQPKLS